MITPITYKEASSLLGVKNVTIKMAIGRGVLTRVPTPGHVQYIVKEQVGLFKGKRLSKDALTSDERSQWETYNQLGASMVNSGAAQWEPLQSVEAQLANSIRRSLAETLTGNQSQKAPTVEGLIADLTPAMSALQAFKTMLSRGSHLGTAPPPQ